MSRKGIPNKRTGAMTFDLLRTLREKNYDPVASLLEVRDAAYKQFKDRTDKRKSTTGFGGQGYLQIVRECDSDIMQYIYPKLKNVEMTGANGVDFFQSFTQMVKQVVDGKKNGDV